MNTIISKKTNNKAILLNKLQTEEFLQSIDSAIHSFDLAKIINVVLNYKFPITPDIRDFLDQAKDVTKVSDKYETIVKNVSTFQTKCVACNFGKTVNGYEIQSVVKDCENIRFTTKTALYFDIVDGALLDFGFCNGFLSKQEVSELNSF